MHREIYSPMSSSRNTHTNSYDLSGSRDFPNSRNSSGSRDFPNSRNSSGSHVSPQSRNSSGSRDFPNSYDSEEQEQESSIPFGFSQNNRIFRPRLTILIDGERSNLDPDNKNSKPPFTYNVENWYVYIRPNGKPCDIRFRPKEQPRERHIIFHTTMRSIGFFTKPRTPTNKK